MEDPIQKIVQNISSKNCQWQYLLVGHVLNQLWFKRYNQKCSRSHVSILIMMWKLLKFMEWFKIKQNEYLNNWTELFHDMKNLKLCLKDYIFRSYDFFPEATFYQSWWWKLKFTKPNRCWLNFAYAQLDQTASKSVHKEADNDHFTTIRAIDEVKAIKNINMNQATSHRQSKKKSIFLQKL